MHVTSVGAPLIKPAACFVMAGYEGVVLRISGESGRMGRGISGPNKSHRFLQQHLQCQASIIGL